VTALVGTTLAIAAVVVTSIFGASFSHLVSTPRLYGDNWQVDLDNLAYPQVQAIAKSLRANPNVTKITYGVTGKYIEVNGYAVETLLVDDVKGPLPFSLASGRLPHGDHQMLVGTTTLSAAHAHVGSRVRVSIVNAKGAKSTGTLLVAGSVVIPPSFQIGGLGDGAVMTITAAEGVACATAPSRASCVAAITATLAHASMGMAVATANTPAGRATAARLDQKFASQLTAPAAPTSLVNFGQAVDFPLLLALTLTLFGAAMLTHLLVVIVTRRRREFAVLRVLGFTRRQVSSSIFWQSTTTAFIGVVFGVPLGLLGGVVIWRDFVTSLGAVPATVIPALAIVVIALLALVCALALAVVPAILTARIRPGEALREG
jgi:ABC-type lipoprotein release transport system permease subunit